jgi:beta-N-acetylhexosaminidase
VTRADDAIGRLAAGTVLAAFEGPAVPDWLRRLLEGGLAGVCLFDSNLQGGPRAAGIVTDLRDCRADVLLAVDEEGGDVTRLQTAVGCAEPGPAALGQADDAELTAAVAAQIGSRLAEVGIDLDLAPSVDVNAVAANPVIGVRAFGDDPALVARHGAAFVRGLQATGVAACAKHFPGHGATDQDSHVVLPRLRASRAVLEARELPPFAAAIDAGVASVMTSHIVIEAIDPDLPATLSPRVVTGLLRGELGWDGPVITDALDMAGASGELGLAGAAVAALQAGCDLLCLGANLQEHEVVGVVAGIRAAVDDGRLDASALEASAARLASLRPSAGTPVALDDGPGRRAALAALTIDGRLPPSLRRAHVLQIETRTSLAVGAVPWGVAEALGRIDGQITHATVEVGADPAGAARDALDAARGRPLVAVVRDAHRHPAAWALLEALAEARWDLVVVEMGWPGGPPRPGRCTIATFGASRASGEAAAELLARPAKAVVW